MSANKNIVYRTKSGLYINLTNRCDSACVFCHRADAPLVGAYDLHLKREEEPSASEVVTGVESELPCKELVYCGYGEPLLRYETLIESARRLREAHSREEIPLIRINTNGHGNLIAGRNLIPNLAGLIDQLSVSLNAHDQATYDRLCPNTYGERAFPAVLEFIREAVRAGIAVTASTVAHPEVNIEACQKLAESLGAGFKVRPLDDVVINFAPNDTAPRD